MCIENATLDSQCNKIKLHSEEFKDQIQSEELKDTARRQDYTEYTYYTICVLGTVFREQYSNEGLKGHSEELKGTAQRGAKFKGTARSSRTQNRAQGHSKELRTRNGDH